MSKLPLSDLARADLEEIAAYISADNPRAATIMLRALIQKCRKVCQRPLAFPAQEDVRAGLRRAVCRPYLIFFVVDQRGVRIERILHGARDVRTLLGA